MLLWHGRDAEGDDVQKARELFKRELFGVDEPLRTRGGLFQGRSRGIRCGETAPVAAGTAFRRQIDPRHPAQAGPRGVQPHGRGGALCHQGLAAARVAPERHSDQPALRVSRRLRRQHLRGDLSLGPRLHRPRVRGRLSAHAGGEDLPVRGRALRNRHIRSRTIPRPPISRTWSGRSICPRLPTWGTRGIHAPGHGPARSMRQAAAFWK